MEATVIIIIYNCSVDELKKTLHSVCEQKKVVFEILFADDHSEMNYKEIIDGFMLDKTIKYKYFRNETNLGTVKNLLNAAYHAKGTYIKPLGCGDTFYSDTSLATYIMNFEGVDVLYGSMQGVIKNGENEKKTKYKNPLYLKPFFGSSHDQLNSLIVLGDHLSGAGLMYKKNIFINYLTKIKDKIIYVEDFIPMFVLLDGGKIKVLNQKTINYSIGTGISTKKKRDDRIIKDANAFDMICVNMYSYHTIIKKYVKILKANDINNKAIRYLFKFLIDPQILIIRAMQCINKRNMYIEDERGDQP